MQQCPLAMLQKWKRSLDERAAFCALHKGLSKIYRMIVPNIYKNIQLK